MTLQELEGVPAEYNDELKDPNSSEFKDLVSTLQPMVRSILQIWYVKAKTEHCCITLK